ncbi:MAG TPA: DoxX family protein [Chitinophaga sp.]|uniref:DoxX family protein n=1 Tax=Chitinophaga sp. TaxID=1869181 RepID=UPI002CF7A718|nr:DoxX family protein [Chitinophaga sp.]HVI48632.1 DoxX family protein [Chitinophaga sp.]
MTTANTTSRKALITGRVIAILCILFLLVDAIMKVFKAAESVKGSVALQWPETHVQGIGIVLLLCTILYAIPRTAILGAILITAYLGGAVSVMARAGYSFYFPVIFGVLVWAALYLQDNRLRELLPLSRKQ